MRGFALGLQLPEDRFAQHGTAEPLVLLRLFNYPSRCVPADSTAQWGVDEHTDYGLLTLLWQDDVGGLQVRTDDGWIDVRSIPGSFVCNVGDMLDFMTGGGYRSVPHRVRPNTSGRDRLSIPFFFDPDFGSRLDAGQGHRAMRARQPRHAGGPQRRGHPRRGGCAHEVGVCREANARRQRATSGAVTP